jgi:hypothetical protein
MGTDFNVTPIGVSAAAAPVVRPQPEAARLAVRTELPAPKTPTAPDANNGLRNERQAEADNLAQRIVIDRAAAEIVYRVVDNRTSLIVRQFPDDAQLRLRAYLRAKDETKAAKLNGARAKVDQEA